MVHGTAAKPAKAEVAEMTAVPTSDFGENVMPFFNIGSRGRNVEEEPSSQPFNLENLCFFSSLYSRSSHLNCSPARRLSTKNPCHRSRHDRSLEKTAINKWRDDVDFIARNYGLEYRYPLGYDAYRYMYFWLKVQSVLLKQNRSRSLACSIRMAKRDSKT